MKILFLSSVFPDADDPIRGTYNFSLCRELASANSVRVIAPRPFTHAIQHRLQSGQYSAGEEISSAGITAEYPTHWYTPKVMRHRYGDMMMASIRSHASRVVREFRPDVVLSYWIHPDGDAAVRVAEQCGALSAVIVGGCDALNLPKDPKRKAAILRVLDKTDFIITVSDGLRRAVMDLGVEEDRVYTIYQGIDDAVFHPGEQREARRKLGLPLDLPVLLWVGRMVSVKALDVLIQACSQLRVQDIAFRLCLAGDGPLKTTLEEQVAAAGLDPWVRFVGQLPPKSLPDWYQAADMTVLSSWSEGIPNVLRESLACGTPFVSTDVGSIREIAHPDYARLVEAGKPDLLAAAIRDFLDIHQRSPLENYRPRTWKTCANDTMNLFQLSPKCRSARGERPPVPNRESIAPAA